MAPASAGFRYADDVDYHGGGYTLSHSSQPNNREMRGTPDVAGRAMRGMGGRMNGGMRRRR